jgi:cytochrome P450
MTTSTTGQEDVGAQVSAYLADTSSLTDPFPLYQRLRETDPVHWSERNGFWVVTGYDEVEACYLDERLSRQEAAQRQFRWIGTSDDPPEIEEAVSSHLATILNLEPPDHTRLRALVSSAFTPRAVKVWRDLSCRVVDETLAAALQHREFDFLREVGYPIPERIICEVLGVPVEDHDKWKTWAVGLGHAAIFIGRNRSDATLPPGVREAAQQALLKWYGYFRDLAARRRADPGDDLVSALVNAEEAGDRLSEQELVGALMLLVSAGHETTANLITNGLLALMRNPDQYALLRQDPQAHAAGVVTEVLRYDGPARGQPRVAVADVELGGKTIRAGDMVMVVVNAANRDPAVFPDPDRFDITRRANRHLAFGAGIHYCVGAGLARMEAEIAFERIGTSDATFELAAEQLAYKPTHGRNLTALPVLQRT